MEMIKNLILIIVIAACQPVTFSQEGCVNYKNVVSFETGVWSRGLGGISYSRNFNIQKSGYLSATVGYGIGRGLVGINQYGTLNISGNFGKKWTFFCLGLEGKYVHLIPDIFYIDVPEDRVTIAPALGFKTWSKKRSTLFEFRVSCIPLFYQAEVEWVYPSLGLSLGKFF